MSRSQPASVLRRRSYGGAGPWLVAVFVSVGVAIAGAGTARAQTAGMPKETGMLPNGERITWERFFIREGMEFKEPSTPDDQRRYLNLAHCTCAKADAGDETEVQYELKLSAQTSLSSAEAQFWVGTNCDTEQDSERNATCRQLTDKTIADINTLFTPDTITFNLFDLIAGKDPSVACPRTEADATAWLLVRSNNDYIYTTAINVGEKADVTGIDTQPPEIPSDLEVSGSEGSIEITWTPPESRPDDLYAFQALCSHADDTPVFTGDKLKAPRYQTASTLCGAASEVELTAEDFKLPGQDEVTSVPFANLQKEFICGEQLSGTARSLRIEGLKNGEKYKVALLALDDYGNAVGRFFSTTVSPQPVTDFWEDLNDRESAIDGGCLLSTTYGDGNPLTRALRSFRDGTLARSALGRWLTDAYYATIGELAVSSAPARIAVGLALLPFVVAALLWHLLGLPALLALLALPWLWRRRAWLRSRFAGRGRRLAMAASASALLLAPRLAAADDFMPYWEDPAQEEGGLEGPAEVRWHVGVRVGPYTPDIDLQFHQNAITGKGPYEAMFGDYYTGELNMDGSAKRVDRRVYQVLPMLDVDRIIWRGFGHIGVGGSLGYMQKTAYAYASESSEDDPFRPRITSAENTFRLIPFAATLTYRFTYLDDRWGIPVVPYVRGGLAYYVWWMKGPNGDVSKACDSGDDPCTDEDKAYGGTPGVQVSAGLAIRAERIDADAARSMRNSGIQHAGFYGEVFWGRVDGFNSSTKLWVGDTTWFAGANFEF